MKILFLLLLLGTLVPVQQAQTTGTTQQPESVQAPGGRSEGENGITMLRTSVQEVSVIFTATNKKGQFKRDLRPTDVAVFDDGKPPAAVRSFRSETDLPLRVGLVFDVSGSISDRFNFEQESAIRFFSQVLRKGTDKAFVVAFDSTPTLTQDFTDEPALLAQGVKKLTPAGGSAVYDAIHLAATKKLMDTLADRPVRRIIILISDGEEI